MRLRIRSPPSRRFLSSESESVIRSVTIGPQTRAKKPHDEAASGPEPRIRRPPPLRKRVSIPRIPSGSGPGRRGPGSGGRCDSGIARPRKQLLAEVGHELRNRARRDAERDHGGAAGSELSSIRRSRSRCARARLAIALIEGILDVAREHGDFRIRWEAMKLDEVVDCASARRPARDLSRGPIPSCGSGPGAEHPWRRDASHPDRLAPAGSTFTAARATPGSTIEVITEKVGDRAVVRVRSTAPDLTAAMGSSATPSRSTSSVHRWPSRAGYRTGHSLSPRGS